MPAEKEPRNPRRSFLKTLGLIGGACVAAPLAWKGASPRAKEDAPPASQAGYRLTAHIRKYYETAAK